jgi:hypothetical protein
VIRLVSLFCRKGSYVTDITPKKVQRKEMTSDHTEATVHVLLGRHTSHTMLRSAYTTTLSATTKSFPMFETLSAVQACQSKCTTHAISLWHSDDILIQVQTVADAAIARRLTSNLPTPHATLLIRTPRSLQRSANAGKDLSGWRTRSSAGTRARAFALCIAPFASGGLLCFMLSHDPRGLSRGAKLRTQ